MAGIEVTLNAMGMKACRMTHNDIFLEVKRTLHPLGDDVRPYRSADESLWYESARSQMANVNIEDEQDDYLKIGGLLYSWISLKDLPDATFPGILRELVVMDFPLIVNAEVALPDQSKAIKQYKSRLRKMTAAQKDFHGGFRINVDAQVAEHLEEHPQPIALRRMPMLEHQRPVERGHVAMQHVARPAAAAHLGMAADYPGRLRRLSIAASASPQAAPAAAKASIAQSVAPQPPNREASQASTSGPTNCPACELCMTMPLVVAMCCAVRACSGTPEKIEAGITPAHIENASTRRKRTSSGSREPSMPVEHNAMTAQARTSSRPRGRAADVDVPLRPELPQGTVDPLRVEGLVPVHLGHGRLHRAEEGHEVRRLVPIPRQRPRRDDQPRRHVDQVHALQVVPDLDLLSEAPQVVRRRGPEEEARPVRGEEERGREEARQPLHQEGEPPARDALEELLRRREVRRPREAEDLVHGLAVLDPVSEAAPRLLLQLPRRTEKEVLVHREVAPRKLA